jgi:hypothetical protein
MSFAEPIIAIAEAVRPPASQPASHENHESQEPLLRVKDPQIHGSYFRIVTLGPSDLGFPRDSQVHIFVVDTPFCSDPSKQKDDLSTHAPISSSIPSLFIDH